MTITPREAERLRDLMISALLKRRPAIRTLDAYRDGEHPLPDSLASSLGGRKAAEMRALHRETLRKSRTNWVGLVVDAVAERLSVNGFSFPKAGEQSEEKAWEIYQANGLDASSLLVQDSALATGQSYVSIWADPDDALGARIVPESGEEMICAYRAGSLTDRVAALKRFSSDDGRGMVTLYLPDEIWKWQTRRSETGFSGQYHAGDSNGWEPRRPLEDGPAWPMPNPLGKVPIVEFRANPRLRPARFGGGRSEFAGVLDVQNRINETVFGRMVSVNFHAFPQKWATGMDIPTDDSGRPIEPFEIAVNRLILSEDPDTKFGQFPESNFSGYLSAVEADVQHLAALSHTPPYYLLGKMENISADAILASEAGLVQKVERHQIFLGESWEEVMRIALQVAGDTAGARDRSSEVSWADPATRSIAQQVDAATKLDALGLPKSYVWAKATGASAGQIRQWEAEKVSESLLAPIQDPTPAPAPAPIAAPAPVSPVAAVA